MYEDHFQFIKEPFSIAPDPSFLFLSDGHNEALAHLMYGFSHGGFVLVTGEVGTGKTTLLRNLVDRTPADLDVAFILNPRLTVKELLETTCEELGVALGDRRPDTVKQYIDHLNRHLLKTHRAGRGTVVIIDEAQNLSPAVLEQIRLLTNLETNERKLLRIILLGQPELADMLARTELRQLAQRITARYHLNSLNKAEVADYVAHRLARAGGNPNIFDKGALGVLYRASKGTPRLINVIADRALLGAYVAGTHHVSAKLVRQAAREVFGAARQTNRNYWLGATALVLVVGAVMTWAYLTKDPEATAIEDGAADLQGESTGRVPGVATPDASPPITSPQESSQASNAPRSVKNEIAGTTPQTPPPPAPQREIPKQTAAIVPPIQPDDARQSSTPMRVASPVHVVRPQGSPYQVQREAFHMLFELWGADYPVHGELIPCDFAPTVALQCLRRSGGWSELDGLNTPVVMELWDDERAPFYGVLARRNGERYDLRLSSKQLTITARDLRDAWVGSYILLWRTPPDYNGSLRQGDTHTNVPWLRGKLAELDSQLSFANAHTFFGTQLHDAVIQFQRTEGLLADGIVGPLTWIRLSDRLGLPGPKLNS